MSDDESKMKVAGHKPAVKAGGMRIVQHKNPNSERPGKDPVEVIGLAQNNPLDTAVQLSSSPTQKSPIDTGSHVAHQQKPPINVPSKPLNNIQQPRK
ncbi:death-associated protein 1 [Chironomus tepperi]|uniref:death-associated protein 1 n=1 Tax=Chironomus tepperi TaxID=113505 RepID=UPI00391EFAE0